jgi:hypothetical protein
MFVDAVHWLDSWNSLVSAEIVKELRRQEPFRALPWSEPALSSFESSRRGRGEGEDFATLAWAFYEVSSPKPSLSWRGVVYLEHLARRNPRWFSHLDELAGRARSRANSAAGHAWGDQGFAVDQARLRWHLGEAWLLLGERRRARKLISSAAAMDGVSNRVLLSRAVAEFINGDKERARETLLEAAVKSGNLWQEAGSIAAGLGLEPLRPDPGP